MCQSGYSTPTTGMGSMTSIHSFPSMPSTERIHRPTFSRESRRGSIESALSPLSTVHSGIHNKSSHNNNNNWPENEYKAPSASSTESTLDENASTETTSESEDSSSATEDESI